jgi:hypothetical protein
MKSLLKIIIFIFFVVIMLQPHFVYSQESIIKISGVVIDKKDKQPIPFVNVGIVELYIGTTTNLEGYFEFKVPSQYSSKIIQISAVGYETITMPASNVSNNQEVTFELMAKDFAIEAVDVNAKSLYFLKVIRESVKRIPENYLQKPFNYDAYYRSELIENSKTVRLREAALRFYDSKGYVRGNALQVFKERNYKILQVKKNFKVQSLADASTNIDELLEMDIVRVRQNILDTNYLSLYDFNLEKITEYEGDSVWVISYSAKSPSLASTGDYYVKKYVGKLYINKKDYAIVKNETNVESTNYSNLGRSLYVNEKKQDWQYEAVSYNFTTIYKKSNKKYSLSYMNYNRLHKKHKKTSGEKTEEKINTELMINKLEYLNPEEITKKQYHEDMPYDETFWNNYNYLSDLKKK